MLIEAFSEALRLITSANPDLYEILWLSVKVSLCQLRVLMRFGIVDLTYKFPL